jgi:hypothetical protein
VNEIRVASGTLENAFDLWSNDLGLYNENQVLEGDPDNDGINNLWEWGLGSDPLDPDSQGHPAEYLGLQMGETNYIVYLYTRTRYGGSNDRRPAHFLVETDNLVFTPFVKSTNYIQTGAAFDADFWTHTNLVPVTSDQKFIKLDFEWSE